MSAGHLLLNDMEKLMGWLRLSGEGHSRHKSPYSPENASAQITPHVKRLSALVNMLCIIICRQSLHQAFPMPCVYDGIPTPKPPETLEERTSEARSRR